MAIEANSNGWLWPGVFVTTIITLALAGNLRFEFDAKKFPVVAVEFIKHHPIHGNMFNGDEFGDYIIDAAWPRYKVFSDGRSDMYGEQYGRECFTVARAQLGWEEIIQRHEITWSIFHTYSPLTGALKNHPDWHLVYSDKLATVFVKRTPEHEQLIKQFQEVKLALD